MEISNVVSTYYVSEKNVPLVGKLTLAVQISEMPIYDNDTSIKCNFLSTRDGNQSLGLQGSLLGRTTISYGTIKASNYRSRISVDIGLSSVLDRNNCYNAARSKAIALLPEIIREHERSHPRFQ